MNFLGVGVPELIFIAILALIFVGPQRLPEVMGQIGRTVRELRRQASEVTRSFTEEFDDIRTEYRDLRTDMTNVREQVRAENAALQENLRAANAELRAPLTTPPARKPAIETTAVPVVGSRTAASAGRAEKAAASAEAGTEAGGDDGQKVVRMQRRSSKRPRSPSAQTPPEGGDA